MTRTIQDRNVTLVLGGTGKTGRRVVDRLEARGLPTRVGSRPAHPPFDWDDEATWEPVLRGVSSVYISYYPDLAIPGAVERVRSLAEMAVSSGVRRLVLLSGRGEDEAQRAESVIEETELEWTILRCAWFSQNFSENYLLEPVIAGEVALPAGGVPEPFVDANDIADVAVAALTEHGHAGRLYLFGEVLDGRNAYTTYGVQRALGRQPGDFADYAHAAAASGVWTPSALAA